MGYDLLKYREQVMEQANRALDAAWPERKGEDFVRQSRWAISEFKKILTEMSAEGFDQVEQSRTYRFLGSVYADLEPALGKEMLLKAKEAYQTAETLIEGQSNKLEQAKLNFNFANTLRLIEPNDMEQLQEAKQRLLDARTFFSKNDAQYLTQVDAALNSVDNLLRIAPLAKTVQKNIDDMSVLQKQLLAGGKVSEVAEKTHEIMKRRGGAAGIAGQLKDIVDSLPPDLKKDKRFRAIEQQMNGLTDQILNKGGPDKDKSQILDILRERLKSEVHNGKVKGNRAESIQGILDHFGTLLSGDKDDASTILTKIVELRKGIGIYIDKLHYLSHGINRPPAGSRAADLVELNWQLRRFLHEEMNRSEKGEVESKTALEMSIRATKLDRRIYESGTDNSQAMIIEKEELRPLALEIRYFSGRMNSMPARPIWHSAQIPVDSNAVLYSGSAKLKALVAASCQCLGLEIIAEPIGENYAGARWQQLQKALTTVFDLRVKKGQQMSSVTYELGIALTLGKPVVVLVSEDQIIPFDVDVNPVVLTGGPEDDSTLASAIDQSAIWTYPRSRENASLKTLEYILSMYQRPQQNIYVDQTLRMLTDLRKTPDSLAISQTLVKFFDYLKDGETMLICPRWSPVYAEVNNPRLFHVMPFKQKWSDKVTEVTREVNEAAGVKYVRGDEVAEPNIIRSIWEEIAKASYVLADLTGFNANVALELGIAHTLGKKVLMMGQGDPKAHIFHSISKLRVMSYDIKDIEKTLGKKVTNFILSK